MKYKITWEKNGAIIVFNGSLTVHDVINCQKELQNSERHDGLEFVISDYTKAVISQMSDEDRELTLGLTIGASYTLPSLKLAIIATEIDAVNFAKYRAEKYKEYGLQWEIRIFSSIAEARNWI